MRLSRVLAAIALPLALTACSQQPAPSTSSSAASPAVSSGSAGSVSTSEALSSASSDSPSATESGSVAATPAANSAPSPLPVIASRKVGKGLVVSLNSVMVQGEVTTVTFTVANQTPGGHFQVGQAFSDGIYQKAPNGKDVPEDSFTVDGVYLVDPGKAQRYLPGRGADGQCACSNHLASVFIDEGESNTFSAVFKALPADTQKIAVYIPQVGMFDNVPVSR